MRKTLVWIFVTLGTLLGMYTNPFLSPIIIHIPKDNSEILSTPTPFLFHKEEEIDISMPEIIPHYTKEIFDGVYYMAVKQPVDWLSYHVIYIDLTNPNLNFLVTPSDDNSSLELKSMTTTRFVRKYDLDLAINGDGWKPWKEYNSKTNYDIDITSYAMSNGNNYSIGLKPYTIFIDEDNLVSIGTYLDHTQNAITGLGLLLENGEVTQYAQDDVDKHPRTAIGLDESENVMIWVVIDGRQPLLSNGATMKMTADIMKSLGAYTAVNMDGGGSSTMAVRTVIRPMTVNSPCNIGTLDFQRSVGNHLGIVIKEEKE